MKDVRTLIRTIFASLMVWKPEIIPFTSNLTTQCYQPSIYSEAQREHGIRSNSEKTPLHLIGPRTGETLPAAPPLALFSLHPLPCVCIQMGNQAGLTHSGEARTLQKGRMQARSSCPFLPYFSSYELPIPVLLPMPSIHKSARRNWQHQIALCYVDAPQLTMGLYQSLAENIISQKCT